jgi:putative ABC transport system permease protein
LIVFSATDRASIRKRKSVRPFDYVTESLNSLRKNRLRAVLTMLSIIVGVLAVILTLEFGAAARLEIERRIASLGMNLIVVNSGPPAAVGEQSNLLYASDVLAILRDCPRITAVAPQQETRLPIGFGEVNLSDNFVEGVTASYAQVRRVVLAAGRFINREDDLRSAKVAILGWTVRKYLFGGEDPVEKWITIDRVDFQVIGVFPQQGGDPGLGPGMITDDRVFIPLSSLDKRLLGTRTLQFVDLCASSKALVPEAAQQVRELLDRRHPGNHFDIQTQLELMQASNSISGIVTLLLTALAAVSLVVGGIGIMNIMLVAVTERTREIGIRRAVGARQNSILIQFLFESAFLSLAGGSVGVPLGLLFSAWAERVFEWSIPILPVAMVLALGSALTVGVIAGVYPAFRASRLNLVDALGFE